MKHVVYMNDVHVSSYANLVLLERLYKQIENSQWQQQRASFLYNTLNLTGKLQCKYCRRSNLKIKSRNKYEQATVDHIIPKSMGGNEFSHSNFAVCCLNCNLTKATKSEQEFVSSKYIKKRGVHDRRY